MERLANLAPLTRVLRSSVLCTLYSVLCTLYSVQKGKMEKRGLKLGDCFSRSWRRESL